MHVGFWWSPHGRAQLHLHGQELWIVHRALLGGPLLHAWICPHVLPGGNGGWLYFVKNAIYKFQLKEVLTWASEQVIFNRREIGFIDDWDPERRELKKFRVLRSVDDAESGEEYFREVEDGTLREAGQAPQIAAWICRNRCDERLHPYMLSDGEGAEEEAMEVDEETQQPVAAVSAAMAHGQGEHEPGATSMRSSMPGTSSLTVNALILL